MRSLKFICFVVVCLFCRDVSAQNTFAFKAKVIHNKKGLMKNLAVLVNSNPAVTNDAGILVIGLPNNTTHIKVSLAAADYSVLYPTAGYVAIPRDLNDMPEIIIGNPNDNTYLNQYLSLYKEIKTNSSAGTEQIIRLNKKLDSLQASLLQMNYTEDELHSAKDRQDGRDKYYQEISENFNDFISRAIDLKTAFEYVASYAFENPAALQQLNKAVSDYTDIYNTLNRQRNNYAKYLADYWQNDSLSQLYTSLVQYALDSVHTGRFFPMKDDINSINQYFSGNKSKELKDKIQTHIKEQMDAVQPMLGILKQRNTLFQQELSL